MSDTTQRLCTNHPKTYPPAIRTLRVKEAIRNIHQKRTKSDNYYQILLLCFVYI